MDQLVYAPIIKLAFQVTYCKYIVVFLTLWIRSDIKHINKQGLKKVLLCDPILCLLSKLDGVGPVDNRPSPDKLDYFEKKKYI